MLLLKLLDLLRYLLLERLHLRLFLLPFPLFNLLKLFKLLQPLVFEKQLSVFSGILFLHIVKPLNQGHLEVRIAALYGF